MTKVQNVLHNVTNKLEHNPKQMMSNNQVECRTQSHLAVATSTSGHSHLAVATSTSGHSHLAVATSTSDELQTAKHS